MALLLRSLLSKRISTLQSLSVGKTLSRNSSLHSRNFWTSRLLFSDFGAQPIESTSNESLKNPEKERKTKNSKSFKDFKSSKRVVRKEESPQVKAKQIWSQFLEERQKGTLNESGWARAIAGLEWQGDLEHLRLMAEELKIAPPEVDHRLYETVVRAIQKHSADEAAQLRSEYETLGIHYGRIRNTLNEYYYVGVVEDRKIRELYGELCSEVIKLNISEIGRFCYLFARNKSPRDLKLVQTDFPEESQHPDVVAMTVLGHLDAKNTSAAMEDVRWLEEVLEGPFRSKKVEGALVEFYGLRGLSRKLKRLLPTIHFEGSTQHFQFRCFRSACLTGLISEAKEIAKPLGEAFLEKNKSLLLAGTAASGSIDAAIQELKNLPNPQGGDFQRVIKSITRHLNVKEGQEKIQVVIEMMKQKQLPIFHSLFTKLKFIYDERNRDRLRSPEAMKEIVPILQAEKPFSEEDYRFVIQLASRLKQQEFVNQYFEELHTQFPDSLYVKELQHLYRVLSYEKGKEDKSQ